jgi:hypothetical protein
MKKLTTMTAIVTLIAGVSFAHAQNATTPGNKTPPPSSINAASPGTQDGKSGTESTAAAKMKKNGMKARDQAQANPSVSPSDINAKTPDTQSSKSGSQTAATKKMKKRSTTGMKAGGTSNSNVSPGNIDAKAPDTQSSKSGSQSSGTGPSK